MSGYVWPLDTVHALMRLHQVAAVDRMRPFDPAYVSQLMEGLVHAYTDAALTHAVDIHRDDLAVIDSRPSPWGLSTQVTVAWFPRNRPGRYVTDEFEVVGEVDHYHDVVPVRVHCTEPWHDHYSEHGDRMVYRIAGWREDDRSWVLEPADEETP